MQRRPPFVRLAAGVGAVALCSAASAATSRISTGAFVSADAVFELAQMCPSGTGYPQESGWASFQGATPQSATSGQPRIDQYRYGQLIATYTSFANQPGCTMAGDGTDHASPAAAAASGCGPFTRLHTWRLWEPGDVFYVYPAVYTGEANQPWFGPQYDSPDDYNAGITHAPDYITVQGVVQNNQRPVIVLQGGASDNTLGQAPVYFDASRGMVMDSINVIAGAGAASGKAGVYEYAASDLTLSNMRISGFQRAGVNGLFGAGGYSGTLTLTGLELDHNGGTNGPAHNAYIGASAVDPNFTVAMSRSWSHDAYYGHLFKSRAQNGDYTGNFFQGGVPQRGRGQAETYLLDLPNGGQVTVRNNVFVKNASGPNSNGMSLTFMMEGASDSRPQFLDVENNTFVTFAETFDGTHANYPMSFLYPNVRPDSPAWPSNIPARIIKNAFVGYCAPGDGSSQDFRGDISAVESFSELTRVFALTTKVEASDTALGAIYDHYIPELGTPFYGFLFGAAPVRQRQTLGARD